MKQFSTTGDNRIELELEISWHYVSKYLYYLFGKCYLTTNTATNTYQQFY